jgi:hypothetical protein
MSDGAKKAKVGFYQDPEDTARARAVFQWTNAAEQHGSFSDFIAGAVMKEVKRLERKHNGGEPWAPAHAGKIAAGRPIAKK